MVRPLSILLGALVVIGAVWVFDIDVESVTRTAAIETGRTLAGLGPAERVGFIVAIGSAVGFLWSNYALRRRDIDARHFERKREIYETFITELFDMFTPDDIRLTPKPDEKEMARRLSFHRNRLFVWGSNSVVNEFIGMQAVSATQRPQNDEDFTYAKRVARAIQRLLEAMRTDLGHSARGLDRHAFAKFIVKADDWKKFLA